ncbi:MAG: preprotein translocase subunit SecB [Dorea sp.]|nr:preprotein translocase subunit SecB [Dorea sp.]MCI9452597.1 preprotein translocase subunit SecB [Dorea sp.]
MKISSDYESPLVLEKIEITESTFRKKDVSLEGLELNVRVDHNIKNIGEDGYEIILSTSVSDVNEYIYINVKGKAIFRTQQKNRDILEKNTIAIMFPYIRSYISIITTQPGMVPIVLPAMNIIAMINDKNK